jgi:uncharacterized protein involved in exopolysaccharide biosynthesis
MEKDKLMPQISLVKLIMQLWSRKWTIIIVAFLSGVLGYLLALDIPKKYRTVVTLAPESTESELGATASSISSMLGMTIGAPGSDAIYPELYPDIINTTPFSVEMLNIPVSTIDGSYSGDLYHYLKDNQKSPWWSKLKSKLKAIFASKDTGVSDVLDPYCLTRRQMILLDSYHKKVTCEVDVKTSVITLVSVMQDKQVACVVADSLCVKLQEYVTAYKTNKAKNDLETIKKLYDEARDDYMYAQQQYASFMDKNANLVRASAKAEAVRLENEQNMTFMVYQEMSSQLAAARAKLQEQTPAFTVLEPARLAEWHFAPKKSIIAIVFAFLGGVGACIWFLYKMNGAEIMGWFKSEEEL